MGDTVQPAGPDQAGPCSVAPRLVEVLGRDERMASYLVEGGKGRADLARLGATAEALLAVGRDAGCPDRARFAAFLAWLNKVGREQLLELDDVTAEGVAKVYAAALGRAWRTTEAAVWGVPARILASPAAKHMVMLGDRALPYLRPLLTDRRRIRREGSETATYVDDHQLRICDLAGALVAHILLKPRLFPELPSPEERDRHLAELSRRLDPREL